MNTPHQIILAALAKMEEGERQAVQGPWIRQVHKDGESHRILIQNGAEVLGWEAAAELDDVTAEFIASSRTQIPLLRELLKQACGALEKQVNLKGHTDKVVCLMVIDDVRTQAEKTLSNIAQKLTMPLCAEVNEQPFTST